MSRDEFPGNVKHTIGLRVNFRCSNPQCGAPTSGPQLTSEKSLNIGVAAHITAASPGGPRFDVTLSPASRASPENGTWLCQNCAKLVDNDPQSYTAVLLRSWKADAEAHAHESIGRRSPFDKSLSPAITVMGEVPGIPVLRGVDSIPNKDLVARLERLLPADVEVYEQIELLDRGLGGVGQPYAILAVGRSFGWDWDVLFFAAGELGWELIARTALDGQKAYVPIARYIPGQPGALVLSHVDGYGTGVFCRSTTWHRIRKGQAVPMINYPLDFYVNGWGMPFGRSLTTTVAVMPSQLRSGELLKLVFTIRYSIEEQDNEHANGSALFEDQHSLTLVWAGDAGMFQPLTSADDLAIVDELWSESTGGWIDRNIAKLGALRATGTVVQRQFAEKLLAAHRTAGE